jgi:SAM-dependent methyltransferase
MDILLDRMLSKLYKKEVNDYIMNTTRFSSFYDSLGTLKLNKLCCVEDWENPEMKAMLRTLGYSGYIHRKDWEWSLGLIAMQRLNKLNEDSLVLGVASGKERIPFYLADNRVKHVYATDLYADDGWEEAPADFIKNPEKYSEQDYDHKRLTAMNMDGRHLSFDSNLFDVVFSFSSVEHFGGEKHSGALKSVLEMERVLKPHGIAIVATEFILNNKDHQEYFNEITIYSDLIDKLYKLKLVEPLDLTMTQRTMKTVLDFYPHALQWKDMSTEYKKNHPHIILRIKNIVYTSIMLVFKKL